MASLPVPYIGEETAEPEGMGDSELVAILAQHEAMAIGYQGADSDITSEQERALAYYNGTMEDLPAQEGSSSVVDGTVALVVDNALAALLKPFISSDETVRFAPRGAEDEDLADQATDFVNYVVNCDNPGFLIFHNWFKDALLSKLGVVKVYWEDQPRYETSEVELQSDLHAQLIRSHPQYMGEENGVASIGELHEDGRVKIENIPPEEFRISPASRSIEDAVYTAHVPANITRSDLHEMGFDAEIVESLPAFGGVDNLNPISTERYADENFSQGFDTVAHKPNDRIALRDEYVRLDYDGDGVAELRRIIRVDDVVLLNEPADDNPFAALCPIPMPHKVYGHSLADRAVQEQKIGTAIWRQALDNLYKSNNPRPVVGDGFLKEDGSTADSLMDNAPGAAVTGKDITQFRYEAVPFTADKTFPMLELLDKKVEENTGVSRAGQGLDTNALRKSGQMTATEMAMIAEGKNGRTEMVARVFAETGVARLFRLVAALLTKHQPRERVIRLRNKWVPMNPADWPEMDVTISVGLGIGDKTEQVAQATSVLEAMQQLGETPFASLIDAEKVYNAVKRLFTSLGIKNTDDFLNEPPRDEQGNPIPPETPPDPATLKAQADAQLQAVKLQDDQQAAAAKLQTQQQEAALKLQLEREKAAAEIEQARERMLAEIQLERERMALEAEMNERNAQRQHEVAMEQARLSTNRPGGELDK